MRIEVTLPLEGDQLEELNSLVGGTGLAAAIAGE